MSGETTTQSPLQGSLRDTGRSPERVVSSGKEEGYGGGRGRTVKYNRREDGGRTRWYGGEGDGGDQGEDAYG